MKPSETLEHILDEWLTGAQRTQTTDVDLAALRAAVELSEAVEGMPDGWSVMPRDYPPRRYAVIDHEGNDRGEANTPLAAIRAAAREPEES